MISVGIDVSKGKSTVCIMKPYGEIVKSPYEVTHTKEDLATLVTFIKSQEEEVWTIMEDTGHYHWPVLLFLYEQGVRVTCVNSLRMKKYCSQSIRRAKTDAIDAVQIANYGITYWFELKPYVPRSDVFQELRTFSRQYYQYTCVETKIRVNFQNLLDQVMPGITAKLADQNGRHKLTEFVYRYWHYQNILKQSKNAFTKNYSNWAKKQGYRLNESIASEIYELAKISIPILPCNDSTKIIVQQLAQTLLVVDETRNDILSNMDELARQLPEYELIRAMPGVGDKTVSLLISEIGDVTRFKNKHSLIAYAGIDAPPYQSGKFDATQRKISKRGNKYLRRIGFEIMLSLLRNKPTDDPVYLYILKKKADGKASKTAMIAGFNKFLRIYYARVMEAYTYIENTKIAA
ncbi:MAG: IS110 family transposase [Lachnospiraceae bacterium]|nr:IS110 family transposase [Lachnospiraceae bacterium]